MRENYASYSEGKSQAGEGPRDAPQRAAFAMSSPEFDRVEPHTKVHSSPFHCIPLLMSQRFRSPDISSWRSATARSCRSVSSVLLALVLALTLAACDSGGGMEEPEPPEPEPQNQEPTASFSVSPGTDVAAGTEITLDASASSDPDGDALTFEWSLSGPSGSTASLSSTSSETPTFTADVSGDFDIALTVRDGNGGDDDAQEVLTATSSVIEVSSDITTDETWAPPNIYRVTTNVGIVGATLTIEPGTRVEFEANASLEVDNDAATLIANGTSDNGILMTGVQQNPGFWGGVAFYGNNANNIINFTTIEYAGGVDFFAADAGAVVLANNGNTSLTNTTIRSSGDAAVRAISSAAGFGDFTSNTFQENNGPAVVLPAPLIGTPDGTSTYTNNGGNYVEIYSNVGFGTDIVNDVLVRALPVPYRMRGYTKIDDGTLEIAAGARLEFESGAALAVGDNAGGDAALFVNGQEGNDVVLIGATPTAGSWLGIGIYTDNPNNQIRYGEIGYGGGGRFTSIDEPANVTLFNGASVELVNSTFAQSDAYGVYLEDLATLRGFQANYFNENALAPLSIPASEIGFPDANSSFATDQKPYVLVRGGTVSDEQTASPIGFGRYRVAGQIYVDGDNAVFTIDAGVTMEFTADGSIYVPDDNASFIVDGTTDERVTLTGVQTPTDGGSWPGIGIESANANNRISNAIIAYGGTESVAFTDRAANIGLSLNARLLIEDSEVNFSGDYGIYVERFGTNVRLTIDNVSYTGNDTADTN